MRDLKNTCNIAVVQAAPIMFDKDACVEKALRLIDERRRQTAPSLSFSPSFSSPAIPLA